jgi:hypothetical protein
LGEIAQALPDLHIHTALAPGAGDSAAPPNVIASAMQKRHVKKHMAYVYGRRSELGEIAQALPDLHVHTALSPCAGDSATPPNIVAAAI